MTKQSYHGSCHCGAVEFTAQIDFANETRRCNCSICWKSRAWFIGIPAADLTLLKGEDQLADYSWTPANKPPIGLHYRFCRTCGIRVYAEGQSETLGGPFYAVAIAALDDIDGDVDQIVGELVYVDGRNEQYGENAKPPADTRLM